MRSNDTAIAVAERTLTFNRDTMARTAGGGVTIAGYLALEDVGWVGVNRGGKGESEGGHKHGYDDQ